MYPSAEIRQVRLTVIDEMLDVLYESYGKANQIEKKKIRREVDKLNFEKDIILKIAILESQVGCKNE